MKHLNMITFILSIAVHFQIQAATSAEIANIIRNTPISGEGAYYESGGYRNYQPPSHSTLIDSNISGVALQAILKNSHNIWNFTASNLNYLRGQGLEEVTIYLAYDTGKPGSPNLQFYYFSTIRTLAAEFANRFYQTHRNEDQLNAGLKFISYRKKLL